MDLTIPSGSLTSNQLVIFNAKEHGSDGFEWQMENSCSDQELELRKEKVGKRGGLTRRTDEQRVGAPDIHRWFFVIPVYDPEVEHEEC